MSKKTIVLADDDPEWRNLYTEILSENGFNVMVAANGLEALSLLHRVQPKLVLLDILMPELDGINACRRIREQFGRKTPIVFLSGLDDADNIKKGLEAGGDGYILKSSPLAKIVERVKYWTNPAVRNNLEERREKALEEMRGPATSPAPETIALVSDDSFDIQAHNLSYFLGRAIAAADSNFGSTPEQRLYFVGYVAGVVDYELGANGNLQPQFMEHMRRALLTGGIMNRTQVEETMGTLDSLTTSETVKNGWEQGRRDKGAADATGADFVPNGLTELLSVA
ncbi:MAG: response regulator [Alphaproteobacteria bacterium]|nr:response regulator [Alphaproteobacteria bacterium]